MQSRFSDKDIQRAIHTFKSIEETIVQLIDWNCNVSSTEDYYSSPYGMQLLAANCTLITAIGEGINRINRILPDFLKSHFPDIPWHAIIGMRNHIAHRYFELDADIVYEAVKNDIPPLMELIQRAIDICKEDI